MITYTSLSCNNCIEALSHLSKSQRFVEQVSWLVTYDIFCWSSQYIDNEIGKPLFVQGILDLFFLSRYLFYISGRNISNNLMNVKSAFVLVHIQQLVITMAQHVLLFIMKYLFISIPMHARIPLLYTYLYAARRIVYMIYLGLSQVRKRATYG